MHLCAPVCTKKSQPRHISSPGSMGRRPWQSYLGPKPNMKCSRQKTVCQWARLKKGEWTRNFLSLYRLQTTSRLQKSIWHESGPKRHKKWVLDKDHKLMEREIPGPDPKTDWADLDGHELEFRIEHRPRPRYLNYSHLYPCCDDFIIIIIIKDSMTKFWKTILDASFRGPQGRSCDGHNC